MKIQFLGSGSSFIDIDENYHSNILLTKDMVEDEKRTTKHLLIDAGSQVTTALKSYQIPLNNIENICITNLAGDCTHGLEEILFRSKSKVNIIGNNQLLDILWDNILSGTSQFVDGNTLTFKDYFNILSLPPKGSFRFTDTLISLVSVPNIITNKIEVPAFGLRFESNNKKVFITGRCHFDYWRFIGFYETYDIIFQTVQFKDDGTHKHTQYKELLQLPSDFRKKMWLYHYSLEGVLYEDLSIEVKEAGFAGLIYRGQIFDLNSI